MLKSFRSSAASNNMDEDDDENLYNELNTLKEQVYTKTGGKGFNKENGLFYTGIKIEGLPEVIYRDESSNLSLHIINERTERHSNREYKKTEGIPLNINDLENVDIVGGDNSNILSSQQNTSPTNLTLNNPTREMWNKLTVKQLKCVLLQAKLPISGNKSVIVDRLLNNKVEYESNIDLICPKIRQTQKKSPNNLNSTRKKKQVKKRKNTDYNAFELVMALLLRYKVRNVIELDDIIETHTDVHSNIALTSESYKNFVIDYYTRSKEVVEKYLSAFYASNNLINLDDIERVELSGKGGDKNEKSDIFFYYKGNIQKYGLSVKQSKEATLSNYSVNLILDKITKNKNISRELNNIKKSFIEEQGLIFNEKSHRAKINESFYDHFNNPYWNKMREVIKENSNEIGKNILNSVFCINSKTIVYEYDGDNLYEFTPKCVSVGDIIEDIEYYTLKRKNGDTPRKTAKMFYNLYLGDEKQYRCEIRHKGSWTASPQFMLFKL